MSTQDAKKIEMAALRFKNAACVIVEERPSSTDAVIEIRRADYNELCKALAEYREAMGGS